MMQSKPLSFTLSLLVILGLVLAACQSTPTGVTATQAETTQPTRRATRTLRPQASATPQPSPTVLPHLNLDLAAVNGAQVDFWHPWRGDLAARAEDAVRQFNKENTWGIRVRVRALNSAPALHDAVEASLADPTLPEAPEVLAAAPEELAAWMGAGHIMGLDDYLNHPEWGLKSGELSAFQPQFWQQDQSGGQQIGIPAVRSARVLFYNQTWAAELGFRNPPVTPQEFKAQACAAAQANNADGNSDKHFTGGWLIDTHALTLLSWLDAFDAQVLPVVDGAPYTFETEAAENALTFLRKLSDDGCAWSGRSPTPHDYFANRMALFYSGTLQDLAIQAATQQRLNSGDRWTVLAYPSEAEPGIVYSQGYSYGVLTGTPSQQLAGWLFTRWMSQPHNQALLAEVWPSFPITTTAESELSDYKNNFPWSMILPLQAAVRPAPALASWPKVRVILEDAAMLQLFLLPVEQMKFFLPELDKITREVLSQERIER